MSNNAKVEEIHESMSVDAVYTNRIFASVVDAGMVKLVFAEENKDADSLVARNAIVMSLGNAAQLAQIIQTIMTNIIKQQTSPAPAEAPKTVN
jgi:uncharacterized membrane protein